MHRSRIAVVATLFATLALVAGTASAGEKFKCNAGGRVFSVSGQVSAFDAVLTWIGGRSDNDLVAVSELFEGTVAIGAGIEDRIERIAFGTLPGDTVEFIAFRAGGPNTNCILNINASIQAASARIRVRDRGSLVELAKTDPRYAEVLEWVEVHRTGKQRIVP